MLNATNITACGDGGTLPDGKPNGQLIELSYDAKQRLTRRVVVRSALFKLFSRWFNRLSPLAVLIATVALGLITICDGAVAQTAQSSTTRYEYDANGNLIRIIDPLGRVTVQRYDTSNRLVQQQLPAPVAGAPQPVIAYSYDAKNQITGVKDPRNLPTQYTVDGLGNQTVLASPDSGVTTRTFDAAGNLTSTKDARGQLTTIDHDALGRITRIAYASGTPSTFEYDLGSAGAIGRLSKMTDESGQTSYIYDNAGRLVSKNVAIGAAGKQKFFAVGYAYGSSGPSNGKVIDIAYPSGNHVFIDYGEDGQASGMSLLKAGATTPVALVSEIQYHPSGAVQSWIWGNSTAAVPNRYFREFDLHGRVTRFPLGNILKGGVVRTITYDAAGRITKTDHVGTGLPGDLAPSLNQSYGYDDLDRLTNFAGNGTTARYQYDASGNRTQLAYGGQTFFNKISPVNNQLQQTTGPMPTKTNSYDAAGNLITDSTITYLYNARGRLQSAQSGSITAAYRHNGVDQRAVKIVKTGSSANASVDTINFIYDESGQLMGEYDVNSTVIQEIVYIGNFPIAIFKNGKTNESAHDSIYYSYNDHINTPRLITSSMDNQIVWRWDLTDPFGAYPPNDIVQGRFSYNQRFPGQYYDKETNLHYNYFRDYDPQTGRYVQSDPIGLNGGMNTYAYGEGNPVSYVDPTGEIAFIPIVIGIGVGYAFDYALERYKKEHCTCQSTPAGAAANAAAGGAVGGAGRFASKPRGGIAGGGSSGTGTSSFSQMNHAAAKSGVYSVATRNGITKVLRTVPYAGAALAVYEVYDAFSCE